MTMQRGCAAEGTAPRRTLVRRAIASGWLAVATIVGCAHRTVSRSPRAESRAIGRGDSVAVGYGMQLARNGTGPVGSIVVGDGRARPSVARIEELLERLPGIRVTRLGAGDFTVQVRGPSGILSGSEPLWVVDGQPMPQGMAQRSMLSGLNPTDVARIDVLRGAAAAIYGSRGTNGVILVTLRGARR
jgi:TonB-dependent SusC/RagA subfamily outer membrane receptor